MREGEELVLEPFQRLIERRRLSAYRYEGFWRAVDTFKDLTEIEALLAQGPGPWERWRLPSRPWNNRPVPLSASETGGITSWASGS